MVLPWWSAGYQNMGGKVNPRTIEVDQNEFAAPGLNDCPADRFPTGDHVLQTRHIFVVEKGNNTWSQVNDACAHMRDPAGKV